MFVQSNTDIKAAMNEYVDFRRRVYCSAQFIQYLEEKLRYYKYEPDDNDMSYKTLKVLQCVNNLVFHSAIQLVLDIPYEEFKCRVKKYKKSVMRGEPDYINKVFLRY